MPPRSRAPALTLLPEARRSVRERRFVPPTTTSHLVPRTELLARLDHLLELRLFMVVAPAGFGKTTLLSQFARAAPVLTAWVSVDEQDADPASLILDIFESVRRHKPAAAKRLSSAIEREVQEGRGQAGTLGALLSDYLAELAEPVVIVLDDYHVAEHGAADGSVSRLMSGILQDAALEHVHVVVGSRDVPRFPFSRLVLSDRVEGLGAEELAFRTEDVRHYLELLRGRPVDLGEAERCRAQTEGWPAGVALMNAGPARSLSALVGPEAVHRYLDEEVMPTLPAELREFAVACSALDDLSVEFCNFCLHREDARAELNELQARNLFIQKVESETADPPLRFHALWRDYLSSFLPAERRRAIQERAGDFFCHREDWPSALRYFMAAESRRSLLDLLVRQGRRLLESGHSRQLRTAIEQVGGEYSGWPAELRVVYADSLMRAAEGERVEAVLESLSESAQASPEVNLLRARAARVAGRNSDAVRIAEEELTLGRCTLDQEAWLHRVASVGSLHLGHKDAAEQHARAALERFRALGNQPEVAYSKSDLASFCHDMGRFAEAERLWREAVRTLRAFRRLDYLPMALNNLASVLLDRGGHDEALDLLREARTIVDHSGEAFWEAEIWHTIGEAQRISGDRPAALAAFQRSARAAFTAGYTLREETAGLWSVIVHAELGEYAPGRDLLESLRAAG
ncbi:MAG: tetratricopeptide repeat protein, partial [Chloroflexi bacterium]|nr:tetratricopeptide repeat protein [Chloroflexota bacterium]